MQIIFESVEERDKFFDTFCMDSKEWESIKISNGISERYCGVHNCRECWEKSGLKYRVEPAIRVELCPTHADLPLTEEVREELIHVVSNYFGIPEHVLTGEKPDIRPQHMNEPCCIQTKDGLAYCQDCEYEDYHEFDEPCRSCGPDHCNFEKKEEK